MYNTVLEGTLQMAEMGIAERKLLLMAFNAVVSAQYANLTPETPGITVATTVFRGESAGSWLREMPKLEGRMRSVMPCIRKLRSSAALWIPPRDSSINAHDCTGTLASG
jgi:hypothetical protein